MELRKMLVLREWTPTAEQRTIGFWRERGFTIGTWQGEVLVGKRGSLWGNFTSFDMSKLLAMVTTTRVNATDIDCRLDVNTVGQITTDWEREFWQLEMNSFESYLLYGDKQETAWEKLMARRHEQVVQIVKW